MTTDAQTQEIPRVPTAALAVADGEVSAPGADTEDARATSVQEMYEAGMARLEVLHDHWAAAVAVIRETQESAEPRAAAA